MASIAIYVKLPDGAQNHMVVFFMHFHMPIQWYINLYNHSATMIVILDIETSSILYPPAN